MYYYYCYTTMRRDNSNIDYWDGVCKNNISDEIIKLKKYNNTDRYYHKFTMIFYKEITEDEYNKLNGVIK